MARKTTKTKAAKKPGKKASKKSTKKAVKKASKKATKKATKKAAKKSGKKAGGKAARKSAKTTAARSAKKASKKAAKQGAKKAPKKAANKTPAKKAVKKATAAKKTAAKKTAPKKTVLKKTPPKKAKAPVVAAAPAPRARRAPSRLSVNRRAGARKPESHEALVVRALSEPPKRAPRKAGGKRSAKKPTAPKSERAPQAARTPKTARARIEARGAGKAGSPQLGNARTPLDQGARKPRFRLHALGLREEHPTDLPRIEMLLRAAQEAQARGALSVEALAELRAQGEIAAALVAEYDNALVGHVALVRVTAPGPEGEAMAARLASLVVDEALRGMGVDAQLLRAALEQARAGGAALALAEGEPELLASLGFAPGVSADAPHALSLGESDDESTGEDDENPSHA